MQTWQFTPFLFFYVATIALSLVLSAAAWRMRPSRGATSFSLFALFSAVWTLGYLLGFFNTQLAWKLAMLRIEYLGATSATFFWLLFVVTYIQYDKWLNRRTLTLLA